MNHNHDASIKSSRSSCLNSPMDGIEDYSADGYYILMEVFTMVWLTGGARKSREKKGRGRVVESSEAIFFFWKNESSSLYGGNEEKNGRSG